MRALGSALISRWRDPLLGSTEVVEGGTSEAHILYIVSVVPLASIFK